MRSFSTCLAAMNHEVDTLTRSNNEEGRENSEGAFEEENTRENMVFKKKHASFKGDRQSHRVRPRKKLKCEYFLPSVQH
jgi:hypothetical protein